jgi:hypothetical protein
MSSFPAPRPRSINVVAPLPELLLRESSKCKSCYGEFRNKARDTCTFLVLLDLAPLEKLRAVLAWLLFLELLATISARLSPRAFPRNNHCTKRFPATSVPRLINPGSRRYSAFYSGLAGGMHGMGAACYGRELHTTGTLRNTRG